MKNNKLIKKILGIIASAAFWIAVWQLASMFVGEDLRLFLPGPLAVFKRLLELLPTAAFLSAVGRSLLRIFSGFLLGVMLGFAFGAATALLRPADVIVSPMMSIIRAVPVVSFIVLAYLFIRVETLPVFICALMVMPLIWQTVHTGLGESDPELIEMCRAYRVGRIKTLFSVKLPYAAPSLVSSAVNSLGLAWKSGVAAEVLCSPAVSIGHIMIKAKNNLEYSDLYAVTLTVVILSLIFETVLKAVFRRTPLWQNGDKTEKREAAL